MKKSLLSLVSGIILTLLSTTGPAQFPMYPETVSMGAGYADEVYYQFSTSNTTSVARNIWDISFRTMIMSSSILTNDGSGVTLWSYPYADTTGWAILDTTGLSSWTPMYNDPTDWENGAFSRNALGGLDFGWAKYNTGTHILTGDSLFVIQLMDGSFKKLWVVEKDSPANTYLFRYANLDGSDFQEMVLDCSLYLDKDFIGFNMQTNLVVDYQPAKTSWDILFTKYMSVQPNGEPYPVTGVLTNPVNYTKKYYPVDSEYNDWEVAPWDSSRSNIGWDWKTFSMTTMTYQVNDSMVFYVKDQIAEAYRLKFTGFEGSSTGNIDFGKARVFSAGIGDKQQSEIRITLYPNPATDVIKIDIEALKLLNEEVLITLLDFTGKSIRSERVSSSQQQITLNIQSLSPGVYLLKVTSGNNFSLNKFIKQ